MLVKICNINDLFSKELKLVVNLYNFKTIRKYVSYKGYLFLCVINNDDNKIEFSVSSNFLIFFSCDYNELSKYKLKKVLDDKIKRG